LHANSAHTCRRKILQRRRTQATSTHNQHTCVFERLLPSAAHLAQSDVAGIAVQLRLGKLVAVCGRGGGGIINAGAATQTRDNLRVAPDHTPYADHDQPKRGTIPCCGPQGMSLWEYKLDANGRHQKQTDHQPACGARGAHHRTNPPDYRGKNNNQHVSPPPLESRVHRLDAASAPNMRSHSRAGNATMAHGPRVAMPCSRDGSNIRSGGRHPPAHPLSPKSPQTLTRHPAR